MVCRRSGGATGRRLFRRVNSYRFSVSLARIYSKDKYTVNEEGVKFYVDLVAELRRLGIEPICTLYHWDMSLWLYERGG